MTLVGIMQVMTKQVGLAMLGVLVLLFILIGLSEKKLKRAIAAKALSLAVVPMAFYATWNAYVKALGVTDIRSSAESVGQFSLSKIHFSEYIDALLNQAPGLQQDTLWNFARALFNNNISSLQWFPISYVTAFALVVALIGFLHFRHKDLFPAKKALTTGSVLFVGTLGYAFMLSVLFLFCFTADEMQELRGYERYVDAYVLGEILALSMLVIVFGEKGKQTFSRPRNYVAAALIAIICFGTNLYYISPQILHEDGTVRYREIANVISRTAERDSSVLLVYDKKKYNGWYGKVQAYVNYYTDNQDVVLGADLFGTDYSKEEAIISVLNGLRDVDYLYVLQTNDGLNEFLSSYNGNQALSEKTIYKVCHEGEQIILEEV